MAQLLRFADYAEIGGALGVTRSAVQKWATGRNVGAHQLRQVSELYASTFGDVGDSDRAILERLEQLMTRDEVIGLVEGVEKRVTETIRATATAEDLVDRYVDRTVEELRAVAPRLFAEGVPGRPG